MGARARSLAPTAVQIAFQASGPSATTDEDGAFSLRPIERSGAALRVTGGTIAETQVPCPLLGFVEVLAPRRTHLQVEIVDTELDADTGQLLDAHGVLLQTRVDEGPLRRLYSRRFPLTDGLSEVLTVPPSAATLVLFRGDREVARRDLRLQPGELHRLRL